MQEPENDNIMEELHDLLNKLHIEADKLNEQIDLLKKKGAFVLRQAESVYSENMRQTVRDHAKKNLLLFVERLVEMNCHLELAEDESPNLKIPYPAVGVSRLKLRFLTGDNPWNFWLIDELVDTKNLHKNLLKKYQNDLLEPYPNPKSQESVCFLDRNKVLRGIVLQAVHENRVKVLDCDSNISKVITSDKVFKVDPDACFANASCIKCAIQKESVNTDIWDTNLRDIFCNALKEAVLGVKILERLPGGFPSFLVDVELENEEEEGNLHEWIVERLLPELRKLTVDENESICDFLSSEALNPYHKYDTGFTETSELTDIPESRGSVSEEDNNLNSYSDKVPVKCLPNIDYTEEEKIDSDSVVVSSSSDEGPVIPRVSEVEIPVKPTNTQLTTVGKQLNQSTTFPVMRPEIYIPVNMPPHFVNYQPTQPQPYRYPPHQYNPAAVPYIPMQYSHPTPPPAWSFQGPPIRQVPYPYKPVQQPSNVRQVNAMAPEFVPKVNNVPSEKSQKAFKKENLPSSATPVSNDIAHMELRKPSSLLKPGDNLLVAISYVVSPAEFYVHFITKNNKYLDKLYEDMFVHYNNESKVHYGSWQEAKRALGDYCACKWMEDNHWYRVQVLEWAPVDNHVRVNFVDHGNIEIVPLHCIQPLAQKFTVLSMCAQLCHLAKVLPSVRHQPWSHESIKFFKSKVKVTSSVYSVTVIPSKHKEAKNNSLSVLLYEGKESENSKSINEEMVECGLAWSKYFSTGLSSSESGSGGIDKSLDELSLPSNEDNSAYNNKKFESSHITPKPGIVPSKLEPEWDNWDPLTEEYKSARNNPARNTDDPCVAVVGYSAKDEARICQFYARDGFCPKPLCTKEHMRPRSDGVTTDKEEVYCRAFSEMQLPSIGDCINVFVTAVASVNLFYVQLPQNRGQEKSDDEEEENLTVLAEFMNNPKNVMKMKYLKVSPAVGQLVIAKWDDQWYRARVVSCDDDILEVMFVDYGSLSTISEGDLREIEPQYLHLPFQAIECSLANIITPDNTSSKYERATETLRELIEGKQFKAEVYDSFSGENFYEMEIILKDEEGDVGERMTETGLVSERTLNWHGVLSPRNVRYYPG